MLLDRLDQLESKVKQQEDEIGKLKQQLISPSSFRPKNDEKTNTNTKRADGRAFLPQSCRELSLNGHSADGFYQVVLPSHPNKLATVYCDFSDGGAPGSWLYKLIKSAVQQNNQILTLKMKL